MALKLGSLFFDIGADTTRLKQSEREVGRTTKRMGKSFQRLGGLIATAISFETVRQFIKIADSMTRLEGRLKVVTRTQKEYNEAALFYRACSWSSLFITSLARDT